MRVYVCEGIRLAVGVLQAVCRIEGEAGDLLRGLPADPQQLHHQVHLVAWRLLERGTAHPGGRKRE